MILRVKPTTTRVKDQQSLYPNGQHTLAFYIKCVPPVGLFAVCGGHFELCPNLPASFKIRLSNRFTIS